MAPQTPNMTATTLASLAALATLALTAQAVPLPLPFAGKAAKSSCATHPSGAAQHASDVRLAALLEDKRQHLRLARADNSAATQARLFSITDQPQLLVPVKFFVMHNGDTGKVKQSQIEAQMRVLDESFSGEQAAAAAGAPDVRARFRLESVQYIDNAQYYKRCDAVNLQNKIQQLYVKEPEKFVHVIVCKPDFLGASSLPEDKPEGHNDHYIQLLDAALPGGSEEGANLGDTLVHEVGHYFGLEHTFEKGCSGQGDYVSDTPAVKKPNKSCKKVDSCPNKPGNDAVENFMDYTPDSCMDRFSPGQAWRMRMQLKEHKPGCVERWTVQGGGAPAPATTNKPVVVAPATTNKPVVVAPATTKKPVAVATTKRPVGTPSPSPPANIDTNTNRKGLLFVGDSDIEYWASSSTSFPGSTNVGVGGWETTNVLKKLDGFLRTHTPEWVVLVVGENDFYGAGAARTFANFKTIVGKITAAGARVVYMGTKPEPDTKYLWSKYVEYDRLIRAHATGLAAQASPAAPPPLVMVDVYTSFNAIGNDRSLYQSDGLHLSRSAYKLWDAWATQAMAAPADCVVWANGKCAPPATVTPSATVPAPAPSTGGDVQQHVCSQPSATTGAMWVQKSQFAVNNGVCAASTLVGPAAGSKAICHHRKTHATAAATCVANGARLCTVAEVTGKVAAGSGCSMDWRFTWTATACARGFVAAKGNGRGATKCLAASDASPSIRCCANDAGETPSSTSSTTTSTSTTSSTSSTTTSSTSTSTSTPEPGAASGTKTEKDCNDLWWWRQASAYAFDNNVCAYSSVKGSGGGGKATCHHKKPHGTAAATCAANGARLCSMDEVKGKVAAGSGCGIDGKLQWTSTRCSNGFLAARGNGSGGATCLPASSVSPSVRCCAE